ncbi:MAG: hypothetical protein RL060_1277 [Bacteroidota bacterium]
MYNIACSLALPNLQFGSPIVGFAIRLFEQFGLQILG